MSNDNSADGDDRNITVKRDRVVMQRERVVVTSQRGSGTNDRDTVKKEIEREAELDVPDGMLDRFPDLIGRESEADVVGQVVETMGLARGSNAEE